MATLCRLKNSRRAGFPPRAPFAGEEAGAITLLTALYRMMDRPRRRQLAAALAAMLLGAAAELLTIGAVLPFLALIADPERAARLPGFGLFLGMVGGDGRDLVLRAALLLVAAAVVTSAARLLILRITQSFALQLGHEIGASLFSRILRQPYSLSISRNSSALLASLEKSQVLVFGVLLPLMRGLAASILALFISLLLFAIEPMTAVAAAVLAGIYLAFSLATRRRLAASSQVLAQTATARLKALREAIGALREILLDRSQRIFEEDLRGLDYRYRRAQATNLFIGTMPRYLVEAAGIAMIALLAVYLSRQPGGVVAAIPVLGALALGAQRLLPLLQQAYLGWSGFAGNRQSLADIVALLQTPLPVASDAARASPIRFQRDIVFDRVGLAFAERGDALSEVSLTIAKGERIGLVGSTGSGKSTLLDLLMALLEPTRGSIRIDGRRLDDQLRPGWQAQIAHVPQSLYLADASVAANIAFGVPAAAIDLERVRGAAEKAQIHGFVASLPEGYTTIVGERGVRLSGGQRQRIGIARALYKQASLLILDEATGALDVETERAAMEAIAALGRDITIVTVAHRLSALAHCDRIVRLQAGRVAAVTNYAEAAGAATEARHG